jgi:hypothetical protein
MQLIRMADDQIFHWAYNHQLIRLCPQQSEVVMSVPESSSSNAVTPSAQSYGLNFPSTSAAPRCAFRHVGWVLVCAVLLSGFANAVDVSTSIASDGRGINTVVKCGPDQDALEAIKLTKGRGVIRVDYRVVKTGEATWTNMDQPLIRQFKVKQGYTFCMKHSTLASEDIDVD